MTRLESFLKLNENRQIWTISKDQTVMQALILMSEKNIKPRLTKVPTIIPLPKKKHYISIYELQKDKYYQR